MAKYVAIAQLRNAQQFRSHLTRNQIPLDFDEDIEIGEGSVFSRAYQLPDGFVIGNRFCIQPMEGWDSTADGKPTDLTIRRWRNFGLSGAKLIWGGEAVAVMHAGRANPNQLLINHDNLESLSRLRQELVRTHLQQFGRTDDLMVGLQLTHSGRFSKPNSKINMEPKILYRHPVLDAKHHLPPDYPVLSDNEIEEIIETMIIGAKMAGDIGFQFVDIKHCHGYLGHEFLSSVERPGKYGGSFENRTRYLRMIVKGIKKTVPKMRIGVRLSAFDYPACPACTGNC